MIPTSNEHIKKGSKSNVKSGNNEARKTSSYRLVGMEDAAYNASYQNIRMQFPDVTSKGK